MPPCSIQQPPARNSLDEMMACSWIKAKQFNPLKAFVDIQRDVQREGDWDAKFTESCDACGFCAQWCHYDAIEFIKASKRSEVSIS